MEGSMYSYVIHAPLLSCSPLLNSLLSSGGYSDVSAWLLLSSGLVGSGGVGL